MKFVTFPPYTFTVDTELMILKVEIRLFNPRLVLKSAGKGV